MKYPVVYSYKRSRTRELELSLMSLKNIKEWNGTAYIIGDNPNLDFSYTHMTIKYDWGKLSGHKNNDETCAYLTAADILEDFIVMADDIYVFKPWGLSRHNRGTLSEQAKARSSRDYYTKSLEATSEFLLSNNKSELSYELHIPTLVNSTQLKEVAELVKQSGKPLLIRSLIGNWFNLPSTQLDDSKRKEITDTTVLYSTHDPTFDYEKIRSYIR